LREKWEELSQGNARLQIWCQEAASLLSQIETASEKISDSELFGLSGELEKLDKRLNDILVITTRKGAGN
jgi:hypothetical protein